MLGKGLESLIPPQRPQPSSQGDGSDTNVNIQPTTTAPQKEEIKEEPKIEPTVEPVTEPIIPEITIEEEEEIVPPPTLPILEKIFDAVKKKDDPAQESIFHIEVDKIRPNPSQPRRDFNQEAIRDLASSIREFGIIQPLVVTKVETETPSGVDVSYELIAGERRLLASKLLGLRVVPAIVRNVGLEREKLELAIIENIQRENLNPVEVARSFQRLQEEFHLTQREVASKLGKSRETVANSVRLLDLPPYIQEALQKGTISESHGRLLLAVEDPAAQKKIFNDISLYRLTTRDVKERVERARRPYGGDQEEESLPPEVRALKDSLSMSLGAPIEIKKGANNGKISITFYSSEELENILRRLGNEQG
jgi:ParB family chromosome partitioning protein